MFSSDVSLPWCSGRSCFASFVCFVCFVVVRQLFCCCLLIILDILTALFAQHSVSVSTRAWSLLLSISVESFKGGSFLNYCLESGCGGCPKLDVPCLRTAPIVFGFFLKQYSPRPLLRTGVPALGIEGCPGEIDPHAPLVHDNRSLCTIASPRLFACARVTSHVYE